MTNPMSSEDLPNWQVFYRRLCCLGPVALTGLPREWIPMLQSYARTGDLFWSDSLQAALFEYWHDPMVAVVQVTRVFKENVQREFGEPPLCWLGPWRSLKGSGDSLIPIGGCIQQIGFRLSARMKRALVRAAQSRFEPRPRRCRSAHGVKGKRNAET